MKTNKGHELKNTDNFFRNAFKNLEKSNAKKERRIKRRMRSLISNHEVILSDVLKAFIIPNLHLSLQKENEKKEEMKAIRAFMNSGDAHGWESTTNTKTLSRVKESLERKLELYLTFVVKPILLCRQTSSCFNEGVSTSVVTLKENVKQAKEEIELLEKKIEDLKSLQGITIIIVGF